MAQGWEQGQPFRCGCSERWYHHRPCSEEDLVHMLSLPMPRWLYRLRVTGSRRFSTDLAQGGLERDISHSFVSMCGHGSTGFATVSEPEGWKYRYNAIALSTYHLGDCPHSKFDLIKILNAKHFVVFIFVWQAIIWNIRKFAPIQNFRYAVYAWGWRDWFCL